MLKIRDNVDLKELEKYGLEPLYKLIDERTGETAIQAYTSSKYCCKWGYLFFGIGKKSHYKKLDIKKNRYINNYYAKDDNFVDIDLLYDLIKDGLAEKVED